MAEHSGHTKRKTRQSKSKTRNGCITCKLRRVKCDETRPSCRRCLNYLGKCDGYLEDRRRALVEQSKSKVILPKIVVANAALTSSQPHAGPKFENDHEARYFQLFLAETSPYLGGAFEVTLWDRLIVQACVAEPFIMHAVVAVGALSKETIDNHRRAGHRQQNETKKEIQPQSDDSVNLDYSYALRKYDKALKEMRKTLSAGERSLQRALLGCLLIVCFEGLHGNQGSASAHAQGGLILLHQWLLANHRLQASGISSPAPEIVDDTIVQAFSRLDIQVLTFLDSRPLDVHLALKGEGEEVIKNMPPKFTDLQEARVIWDLIMRRNGHFILAMLTVAKSRKDPGKQMEPLEDLCEVPAAANTLNLPLSGSCDFMPEHDKHSVEIDRWTLAFEPLYTRLQLLRHKDLLGAMLLKIHAKMSKIMLRATMFRSEGAYDMFKSEFSEIYNLSAMIYERLAISSTQHRSIYHFDLGVIPALFLVGTRCRDRALRRKAVRLLSTSHHREGTWDSIGAARIADWLASMEEEGLSPEVDVIPEHRRARITKLNMNLQKRKAQIQWVQRAAAGAAGELEWHDAEIEWGCCTEFCRCGEGLSLRALELMPRGRCGSLFENKEGELGLLEVDSGMMMGVK